MSRRRYVWPACNRWVEAEGTECVCCGNWRHRECEGLTKEGLKTVQGMKVWFCKPCGGEWKKNVKEHEEVERENAKMKEELKMVKEKNAEINSKMEEFEKKWTRQSENQEDPDGGSGGQEEGKQARREAADVTQALCLRVISSYSSQPHGPM